MGLFWPLADNFSKSSLIWLHPQHESPHLTPSPTGTKNRPRKQVPTPPPKKNCEKTLAVHAQLLAVAKLPNPFFFFSGDTEWHIIDRNWAHDWFLHVTRLEFKYKFENGFSQRSSWIYVNSSQFVKLTNGGEKKLLGNCLGNFAILRETVLFFCTKTHKLTCWKFGGLLEANVLAKHFILKSLTAIQYWFLHPSILQRNPPLTQIIYLHFHLFWVLVLSYLYPSHVQSHQE